MSYSLFVGAQNLIIYKFNELYQIFEELSLDLNFEIIFVDNENSLNEKVKNLNNVNISEKGEMTIVISENPNLQNRLQVIEESVKKKIIKLLKKMSIKDITLKISKENNISKKIIYDFCLKKKNEI